MAEATQTESNRPGAVARIYQSLLAPTTTGELANRRESVLNLTIVLSVLLAVVAATAGLVVSAAEGKLVSAIPNTVITLGMAALFVWLLRRSRRGHQRGAATTILCVYGFVALYSAVRWGINLPMVPLLGCLLVVLASFLLEIRGLLAVTAIVVGSLCVIAVLQATDALTPNGDWHAQGPTAGDGIGYSAMIGLIAVTAWLYTRETRRSVDDLLSHGAAASPLSRLHTKDLTVREVEVVQLVAAGLSDDDIAKRLFVSNRTVHTHVRNALRKTSTANRTQLSVLAVREGLVPLDERSDLLQQAQPSTASESDAAATEPLPADG